MNCFRCDAVMPPEAKSCPSCGASLENEPGTITRFRALDFSDDVQRLVQGFEGRDWALKRLDKWLQDTKSSRFFIITGEPGCGKSAFAARLTRVRKPAAYHFCIGGRAGTSNPSAAVRSLARQLGDSLPGYGEALANTIKPTHLTANIKINVEHLTGGQIIGLYIKHLSAPDPQSEFEILFRSPLTTLPKPERPIFLLIDSLDEAYVYRTPPNLISILAGANDLPDWVRFVCTTRPEENILSYFPKFEVCELDADTPENLADLRIFVSKRLKKPAVQRRLTKANKTTADLYQALGLDQQDTGFNFLFYKALIYDVARGLQSLDDLRALPRSLDDIYHNFLRRFSKSDWQLRFQPLFKILAVAREPLSEEQLARLSKRPADAIRQDLSEALQFMDRITERKGQETYRIYHQSLRDYLIDGKRNRLFFCDPKSAHMMIAEHYWQQHQDDWANCERYGLRYLPEHLSASEQPGRLRELLFNLDWLQAKLQATNIAWLTGDFQLGQENEDFRLMKSALQMSASVLAKHKDQLFTYLYGRLLSYRERSPEIASFINKIHDQPQRANFLHKLPALDQAGGALLHILYGHDNWVNAIAMTPDGRLAVSGGGGVGGEEDNNLRLWDLTTGELIRVIRGHEHWVRTIAMTPDGKYAASAEDQSHKKNTIKVWDLTNGTLLKTLPEKATKRPYWAVDITADGQLIFSVDDDRGIKVWDLAFHEEHPFWEEGRHYIGDFGVNSSDVVAATPDGTIVVSGTPFYELQVFRFSEHKHDGWLSQPKLIWQLKGHTNWISAISLTPDGRIAVSGGHRGDASVKTWDLETGQLMKSMVDKIAYRINAISISADGKKAITASKNYLGVWDLDAGEMAHKLVGHGGAVMDVAMSADGKLACSCSADRTVRVWDLSVEQTSEVLEKHDREISTIVVTDDGKSAITASLDGEIKIWDIHEGRVIGSLAAHELAAHALCVTPDGRFAISGGDLDKVKIWDVARGQLVRQWEAHKSIYKDCIATDGEIIITVDGQDVKIWDFATVDLIQTYTYQGKSVSSVSLTPDSRYALLPTYDGLILIMDPVENRIVNKLSSNEELIYQAVATPDGDHILSGGYDNSIAIWDFHTGEKLHTFSEHTAPVVTLSLSPSGKILVSGSHDSTLMAWDLQQKSLIGKFVADGALYASAFINENTIIAAGESGRLHILELAGVA